MISNHTNHKLIREKYLVGKTNFFNINKSWVRKKNQKENKKNVTPKSV